MNRWPSLPVLALAEPRKVPDRLPRKPAVRFPAFREDYECSRNSAREQRNSFAEKLKLISRPERSPDTAPGAYRIIWPSIERPPPASRIDSAGINDPEPFTITQRTDARKGTPRTWELAKLGDQQDGTFVSPNLPAAEATEGTPARSNLVAEADPLIDAYTAILNHALTTHSGRVKPDEVRGILITVYIQRHNLSTCA
jgi:hypothetical protein